MAFGVGVVAVAVGLLVAHVHDTVSDSSEFADRAAAAFSSPVVREQITEAAVDQIISVEPELVAVQPLLESIVDGALRSDAATNVFRAGVDDLHRTVLGEDDDTVVVQLADLILVAKTQLSVLDPESGALIPDDLTDALVVVATEPVFVDAVQTIEGLRLVALLLPLLGALAFVVVVWMARSGSEALVRVGIGLVAAGVLAGVLERIARAVVVRGDGRDADVARAVWDAYTGEFGSWALVVSGIGGVLAVVAWFGVGESGPLDLAALARALRRRESARGRVLWGLAAVVVGAVFVLDWMLVARFGITVAGAALLAAGIREVVAVATPSLVEGAGARIGGDDEAVRPRRAVGRWITTAALIAVGFVAVVAVARSGDEANAADDGTCNGSADLCDRAYDQVVVAATHNSHAAAREGFLLGYQRDGLEAQLEAGIRALLIDVYFGWDVDDVVITDRAPLSDAERDELVDEIGEAAVRSAEATAARADQTGEERGLFLCHALCEIGATDFVAELGTISRFLEEHPRDVLTLVIQDEGPRPSDIAAAFETAGLLDRLHAQPLDAPWPTLDELADADTRLIVFAENEAGEFDWYHDAFAYVQDTPFEFASADEFSCQLNRGAREHPLFLVNHWLSPVSPTSSAEVNQADVISERVERCTREVGRRPTMIAVDFSSEGDLVEVVAELNGS